MVRTYLKKRNKNDVLEVVTPEAVRAAQERRLSLRVAASRYGMTHTALYYGFNKSEMVMSAIGPMCLLHVTQVSKFSVKTRS
jgi:hypothetical protein